MGGKMLRLRLRQTENDQLALSGNSYSDSDMKQKGENRQNSCFLGRVANRQGGKLFISKRITLCYGIWCKMTSDRYTQPVVRGDCVTRRRQSALWRVSVSSGIGSHITGSFNTYHTMWQKSKTEKRETFRSPKGAFIFYVLVPFSTVSHVQNFMHNMFSFFFFFYLFVSGCASTCLGTRV